MSLHTILLVEDNPSDVFIMKRSFRKAKIDVAIHIASDGEQAIAYLSGAGKYADREKFPLPAAILLDLKLPRRSGFEVLEWVKNQPPLNRIPVVVLTSSRQSCDINRAYDEGANSYLTKTIDLNETEELGRLIHQYWIARNQKPEIKLEPSPGPAAHPNTKVAGKGHR